MRVLMAYSHWPELRPDRDREQMSGVKLCGSFHIIPEPDKGQNILSPIVLVLVPVVVSMPVMYTIIPNGLSTLSGTGTEQGPRSH